MKNRMGTTLESGQIVLVNYPFTDHTSGKIRPALIVSASKFNEGEDVVALPISSRIVENDVYGFRISDTEDFFPNTKLRCSSTVKWSKPMTLSRRVIGKKLGVIPNHVLSQIIDKLQSLFA